MTNGSRIVTVSDATRIVWSGKLSAFFTAQSAALNMGDWRILFRDGKVAKGSLLVSIAQG